MPRSIALAALAAVLFTCGALAQGDPASSSGPTAGPSDPAPSASAVPPGSETALGPDSAAAQPVPGEAPPAAAPSAAASPSPLPPGTPGTPQTPGSVPGSMVLKEGDVVAGRSQDGKVRVMKILKINFVEGDRLLHSIAYKETFHSWEEASAAQKAKSMTVMIAHLPIDGEGLTADANRVLANEPVSEAEMQGYKEYLKEVGQ